MKTRKINENKYYNLSGIQVVIKKAKYANNGTLALLLFDDVDEYYADITVNLGDSLQSDRTAYLDENNLPGIGKWLERKGLAQPMNHERLSGFFSYPLYRINV